MNGGSPLEKTALGKDAGRQALDRARATLGTIILDKNEQIALAIACLLARGHLLIEDLPGLGKTTLAQALAKVLGLSYRRIQFTSDLLPADIVGVSVFRQNSGDFEFQPGPVFAQLVLADEVYEDYDYGGAHTPFRPLAPDRTFSVHSFSKAFGMAGYRCVSVARKWTSGFLPFPPATGSGL